VNHTWRRATFGEFLTPNSRPYTLGSDEDANLVGMRLYGGGPFHRELKSAMQIAKKSHFIIRAGDVLYNKLFAWRGTFGLVPETLDGMLVSDKFPTYQLDRNQVAEGYLRYYFRYPPLWDDALRMSTGSAAVSKLTLNPPKFLLLSMPLPPLEVQEALVARIEALERKVKEARRLQVEAAQESTLILRSVLGRIAAKVGVDGRFGDVLVRPPRNGWSARCDNAESGVPVLSLGAVTGFRYRGTHFKRTSLTVPSDGHFWLTAGDLLMTRSNTPELVGHAAIYDGTPAPCIYPDLMMRLELREDLVDARFVWYWMQGPCVRDFIALKAKGTSPTMKKISQKIVMSIPFPRRLPLPDQRRIRAELDSVQAQLDQLSQLQTDTTAELDALIPSVLDCAFNGRL